MERQKEGRRKRRKKGRLAMMKESRKWRKERKKEGRERGMKTEIEGKDVKNREEIKE